MKKEVITILFIISIISVLFFMSSTLSQSETCTQLCEERGYTSWRCALGYCSSKEEWVDFKNCKSGGRCCCSNPPPPGSELFLHDQPEPLIPQNLKDLGIGLGSKSGLGLNIYFNPQIISNGYILEDSDSVCVGDKLLLIEDVFWGEWFGKGGPVDSPPVEWVRDLDEFVAGIEESSSYTNTYVTPICSGPLSLYCKKCLIKMNIFCSSDCNTSSLGLSEISPKTFEVSDQNQSSITLNCSINCIILFEPTTEEEVNRFDKRCERDSSPDFPQTFGGLNFTNDEARQFSLTLNYDARLHSEGPKLEILSTDYNEEQDILYIKMKNTGDMKAIIDEITFSTTFNPIYVPQEINVDDEVDLIFETSNMPGLMTVKYRSDKLGCLDKKEFEQTFIISKTGEGTPSLRTCLLDFDCLTGEICCENYCRDKNTGFCDDINRDGIPDTWVPI